MLLRTSPPALRALASFLFAGLLGILSLTPARAQAPQQPAAQAPAAQAPAAQAPAAQPAARYRYWTTSWSFQEIDLRDLTKKLASIGVVLPIEMGGTASVNFDVSIPLNGLRESKAYKLRGSLSSPRLRADDVVLEDFAANVVYTDGIVRMTDLRGKQGRGKFAGTATANVADQGPFEAALQIDQIDLGPIAGLLAKLGVGREDQLAKGWLDGDLQVSGQLRTYRDPATWNAEGRLQLRDIVVGDSIPYSVTISELVLKGGRLVAPEISVESSALAEFFMRGNADILLTGTQAFSISLQGNDIPATDLVGLYVDSPEKLLSGKLDLQGKASGEMNPAGADTPQLDVQLSIASPSVQVAGIDLGLLEHRLSVAGGAVRLEPLRPVTSGEPLTIESLQATYEIHPQRFRVQDLSAKLFGGTIAGSVEVARVADADHRADVVWENLQPRFRLPLQLGSNSVWLTATTTGKVKWTAPMEKIDYPAFHRAEMTINVDPLALGRETMATMQLELRIDDSGFDLQGTGQAFGGRVELTSTAPLDETVRWSDVPKMVSGGQLLLSDVSIDKSIQTLVGANPRRYSGRVSGTAELSLDDANESRFRMVLRDVSVAGRLLSRRLDVDVSTQGTRVNIRSIEGGYAGGQLQATGRWTLARGERIIDVRIVRVDGDRMLLPLHESADQWVHGRVSGRGTIVGVGEGPLEGVRISGAGRLVNGQTFGLPVGDAHSPFRILVKRSPLSWQVDFPKVRSDLAHGHVHGELHLRSMRSSGRGFNMDSQWRLHHVEFEELLKTYANTKTIGRGDVTGRAVLSGRDIRSLNDLVGEFRMNLGGTDVTAVPGMSATASLLGAGALVSTRFSNGEAVGRISRGSVVFEYLLLLSDRLKILSSGRVGIADGRLDMTTIATTGNFTGQNQILEQIAPEARPTIMPVSAFNRILSDRTVVVDMVGTLRNPVIQLRPGETLQANLRDFLIKQLRGRLAIETAVGVNW